MININQEIVQLIFIVIKFTNKQLNYVHCCHSRTLTVAPGRPDAPNGNNPGTFARRKSPVNPIPVMPLREIEKVYPAMRA